MKVKRGELEKITQRAKAVAKINSTLKGEKKLKHELALIKAHSKINGDIIFPVFDGQISMDIDNFRSFRKNR